MLLPVRCEVAFQKREDTRPSPTPKSSVPRQPCRSRVGERTWTVGDAGPYNLHVRSAVAVMATRHLERSSYLQFKKIIDCLSYSALFALILFYYHSAVAVDQLDQNVILKAWDIMLKPLKNPN